jgi:hypothetical protein
MNLTFAYLAQGRLYICDPASPAPREVISRFVEDANERARRSAERHGWKNRGADGPEMIPSSFLWRNQQSGPGISTMQIRGVTRGAGSEVIYALNTELIGGLFAHEPSEGSERRLFHKQHFRASHLAKHPSKDLVALAIEGDGLSAHIGVTDTAGHRVREVTEGDSRDESPSWAPGDREVIVFQSAGVARNAGGFPVAVGPYRIEQLDMDRGEMSALIEDEAYDYLAPRLGADGALYCIRRPYSPDARPVSAWTSAKDALLFPFRLARAFVHFFNFFSTVFSGKPLLSAGGPKQEKSTASMMLWGKIIDAENALRRTGKNGDAPGLVPSSWQLIRHRNGIDDVLVKGVLSFDIAPDGSIVYTDGSTIWRRAADGTTATLAKGKMIDQVTVLMTNDQIPMTNK